MILILNCRNQDNDELNQLTDEQAKRKNTHFVEGVTVFTNIETVVHFDSGNSNLLLGGQLDN